MGLTNYEKQKRWREKHRALYNLQQRNRRKALSVAKNAAKGSQPKVGGAPVRPVSVDPHAQSFGTKKVGELRMIVMPAMKVENALTIEVPKPLIFRDDYGRVISETQWKRLQEKKEKAKEAGYVIDDYSQ